MIVKSEMLRVTEEQRINIWNLMPCGNFFTGEIIFFIKRCSGKKILALYNIQELTTTSLNFLSGIYVHLSVESYEQPGFIITNLLLYFLTEQDHRLQLKGIYD